MQFLLHICILLYFSALNNILGSATNLMRCLTKGPVIISLKKTGVNDMDGIGLEPLTDFTFQDNTIMSYRVGRVISINASQGTLQYRSSFLRSPTLMIKGLYQQKNQLLMKGADNLLTYVIHEDGTYHTNTLFNVKKETKNQPYTFSFTTEKNFLWLWKYSETENVKLSWDATGEKLLCKYRLLGFTPNAFSKKKTIEINLQGKNILFAPTYQPPEEFNFGFCMPSTARIETKTNSIPNRQENSTITGWVSLSNDYITITLPAQGCKYIHIIIPKLQLKPECSICTPEEVSINISSVETTASYRDQVDQESKKQKQRNGIQTSSTKRDSLIPSHNIIPREAIGSVFTKLFHKIYLYRLHMITFLITLPSILLIKLCCL